MTASRETPLSRSGRELFGGPRDGWREHLYIIIFEADTRAGRAFDIGLLIAILASVAVVMADSVEPMHRQYGRWFMVAEWLFTIGFTIEYILRLLCVQHPLRYARSGYGIIDLIAILPTYMALLVPGLHVLIDVRMLRMLRVFRILKLGAYVAEFADMRDALLASRRKVLAFLSFLMVLVVIMGSLMYVVEGPQNGFTSVPVGVYWAISTVTTVGFGDIAPSTDFGRFIASLMMLMGWGTLAVPTGIVTAEFAARRRHVAVPTTRTCPECLSVGHEPHARFCRDCGSVLPPYHVDRSG